VTWFPQTYSRSIFSASARVPARKECPPRHSRLHGSISSNTPNSSTKAPKNTNVSYQPPAISEHFFNLIWVIILKRLQWYVQRWWKDEAQTERREHKKKMLEFFSIIILVIEKIMPRHSNLNRKRRRKKLRNNLQSFY
jgi:hypothetical protein